MMSNSAMIFQVFPSCGSVPDVANWSANVTQGTFWFWPVSPESVTPGGKLTAEGRSIDPIGPDRTPSSAQRPKHITNQGAASNTSGRRRSGGNWTFQEPHGFVYGHDAAQPCEWDRSPSTTAPA
jgi:hypothetical protein